MTLKGIIGSSSDPSVNAVFEHVSIMADSSTILIAVHHTQSNWNFNGHYSR